MRARYLAIIRSAANDGTSPKFRTAPVDLPRCLCTDRMVMFSDRAPSPADDEDHVVVGTIYRRGNKLPVASLSPGAWMEMRRSHGRAFVEQYWGDYIGFIVGTDAIRVVRAPFGDVGCFYASVADGIILASDLHLLLAASGHARRIDAETLSRHIAYTEWRTSETCIDGVHELRGGDRLTVSGAGVEVETLWSPWTFAGNAKQIAGPTEASVEVGDAVRLAITARAASLDRSLLLLSGGLDSSIMAACLARAGADFSCLNLVGDDPASDEQRYAKRVADAVRSSLVTREFDFGRVDVLRSGAAHMPYPVHRCFTQAQDSISAEVSDQLGADAIIDGGGGDNVFFATRTVAIVADCLIEGGFGREFWTATSVLGDLGQTGILALAWKAVRRAWFRSRAPRVAAGTAFLTEAARAVAIAGPPHPWLVPPSDVLPGRAAHVALLIPAQNLAEAVNAQAQVRAISPLISQPVVEACLRVPSRLWLAPGQDRAIARRAFAPTLPPAIINRRSKGTPTAFVAAIFDRNRATIRDMLLGGRLAALGILDRKPVEAAIDVAGPVRGLHFVRIMELVDAEAWARAQD